MGINLEEVKPLGNLSREDTRALARLLWAAVSEKDGLTRQRADEIIQPFKAKDPAIGFAQVQEAGWLESAAAMQRRGVPEGKLAMADIAGQIANAPREPRMSFAEAQAQIQLVRQRLASAPQEIDGIRINNLFLHGSAVRDGNARPTIGDLDLAADFGFDKRFDGVPQEARLAKAKAVWENVIGQGDERLQLGDATGLKQMAQGNDSFNAVRIWEHPAPAPGGLGVGTLGELADIQQRAVQGQERARLVVQGLNPPQVQQGPKLPSTDFARDLVRKFGDVTAGELLKKMDDLQIPQPKSGDYLPSTDGVIIFSNSHGVVIRMEQVDGAGFNSSVRPKGSAWVLEPIASVNVPGACLEVCPGVHYEGSDVAGRQLYWKLNSDGYHFWDERLDNLGRLPPTPLAPEGTTVVIDRMSVNQLSVGTDAAKRALLLGVSTVSPSSGVIAETLGHNPLNFRSPVLDPQAKFADVVAEFRQMGIELTTRRSATRNLTPENNPQEVLYGGLRRAFQEAWPDADVKPDPAKMQAFWEQVRDAKEEGRLIPGWNERVNNTPGIRTKTDAAIILAENYGKQPYELGTIGDDIALRTRMQTEMEIFTLSGKPHDINGLKFTSMTTDLPGGEKLAMSQPNIGFRQDALEFQARNGLTDIGQQYVAPYGTSAPEIANYVKMLEHQEARGVITTEQRLSSLTEVYSALETRVPALKELTFDRTNPLRVEEVVNGVAHGYNTKDIQFYVDGNRSVPADNPVVGRMKGHGLNPEHLDWVAAPETLQKIDTQVQVIIDKRVAADAAAAVAAEKAAALPPVLDAPPPPVEGDAKAVPVAAASGGMSLLAKVGAGVNTGVDVGMGAVGLVQGTMGAVRSAKQGDAVGVAVNGANAISGGTAVGVSIARTLGHEMLPATGKMLMKANIGLTVATGVYQVATEKGNFVDTEADGSHNLGNKSERAIAVVATGAAGIGLGLAGVGSAGVVPAVMLVAYTGDKAIEARRAWKDVDRQIAENGAPQRRDVHYPGEDGSPDMRKFKHIFVEMLEVSKDMRDSELPFKPERDPRTGRIKFDEVRKLDLKDPKVMAEFERALELHIQREQKIMKDNDSMLPKWLRFDDGGSKYTDAQMILSDLQGAKTELGWFKQDMADWNAKNNPASRFAGPQQAEMKDDPAPGAGRGSTPTQPRPHR